MKAETCNLRHLRYFVVLAEEVHFRRAAEKLGISQGPLTLAIQALEVEFGASLFVRNRRNVALSEAGAALLPDARAILARMESARETVRQTVAGEVGHLRLGFTNASSLAPFFPVLIHDYRTQHPNVSVSLRELTSERQIAALENRDIDIGLLRLPANVPSDISLTPLMEDRLVVVMQEGHRLAQQDELHLDDLRDEAFIAYPRETGITIFAQMLALCELRGYVPRIVQEAQQASTLIGLAATGLGIAIVPEALRAIKLAGVVFKPLSDTDAVSTLYVACRRMDVNSRARQFIELALSVRSRASNSPSGIDAA